MPANLTSILKDLAAISSAASDIGSELAVSSFIWLPNQDLKLQPLRHASILSYLDGPRLRGLAFGDIERVANFQNRALRQFAADRGHHFLDVARAFPRDPDLFVDAIHNTYAGVRLRAWVVFQQLLPMLRDKIGAGHLPAEVGSEIDRHPAFGEDIATWQLNCTSASITVPPSQLSAYNSSSTVTHTKDGTEILTAPLKYYYAAELFPPQEAAQSAAGWSVEARLRVIAGTAGIGVLTADRSKFDSYRLLTASNETQEVLVHGRLQPSGIGSLLFTSGERAGVSGRLEIDAISMTFTYADLQKLGSGIVLPAVPE